MADNNDWIRKAFDEAGKDIPFEDPEEEAEYQAFKKHIADNGIVITTACAVEVGLGRMNDLSKVVLDYKMEKVLAEFTNAVSTICFHIGYQEGRKLK